MSDSYFRLQIFSESHWRRYALILCAVLYLVTLFSWPYSLPNWFIWALSLPSLIIIVFTLIIPKPKLKTSAVMLLSNSGTVQYIQVDNVKIDGTVGRGSFYLFGIYCLVIENRLSSRTNRFVIYGDQLNRLDNRRLRRVINRTKNLEAVE